MADRAEWAKRVSAWRRSGLTAEQFCQGRGFAASTLRWYSSRFGHEAQEPAPAPVFARLEVEREAASREVVVELGGGRVLVPADADVDTLAAVFAALRRGVEA